MSFGFTSRLYFIGANQGLRDAAAPMIVNLAGLVLVESGAQRCLLEKRLYSSHALGVIGWQLTGTDHVSRM